MATNSSLVIGRKPVLEAILQDKEFDKILLQTNINGEYVGDILRAAKLKSIPVQRVPQPKLNQLSKQNHQGVIALGAIVQYQKLQDIIDHAFEQGIIPRFVFIDGVTDVRNIGAIARTAKCFDFTAVITTEKGNASINQDAVKSSAGAVLQIPIVREKHNEAVISVLQQNGIAIYGSSLQATDTMAQVDFTVPCAVVMGSEEQGMSTQVQRACTRQFIIPMSEAFDSLNVSVACGIICAHVFSVCAQH